jgi:hypothetical protein
MIVINEAINVQNENGVEKHSEMASQYSPQHSYFANIDYLATFADILATFIATFATIVHVYKLNSIKLVVKERIILRNHT